MLETKKIRIIGKASENYVNDLEAFGWVKTSRINESLSDVFQVMTRDDSLPNIDAIRKYESEYEEAKKQVKKYTPMEPLSIIFSLILFFIPCIIYVIVKKSQKRNIEETNKMYQTRMNYAMEEARKLL